MDDRYSYIPLYLAITKSSDSTVTNRSVPIYPIYTTHLFECVFPPGCDHYVCSHPRVVVRDLLPYTGRRSRHHHTLSF